MPSLNSFKPDKNKSS